eukprot:PLAT7268.3.p1 GENE.PLAT7268.3~~PLAT7268.3.p1  ORF type:complete len:236 (-),score=96.83 PLAT7268.3:120-785(-)
MSEDSLLLPEHHEGRSNLLPDGTKAFYASYRPSNRFWALLFLFGTLAPLSAGGSIVLSGGAKTACIAFLLILLFTAAPALLYLRQRELKAYSRSIEIASSLDGLFLFTSGEIVISLPQIELTIAASSLLRCVVARSVSPAQFCRCLCFDWVRMLSRAFGLTKNSERSNYCTPRQTELRLDYIDDMGNVQTRAIDANLLYDDINVVRAAIDTHTSARATDEV